MIIMPLYLSLLEPNFFYSFNFLNSITSSTPSPQTIY